MPAASLEIEDTVIRYNDKITFIQTVGVDFTVYDLLRIWTEIEIRDVKVESFYFSPYRALFRIGTEIPYKSRNWGTFTAGLYHECDHDIVPGFAPHIYNGIDRAYNNLYISWADEFSIQENTVLKPAFSMGILFEDGIAVKKNTPEDYFSIYKMNDFNNSFYMRLGGEADLFRFLKISAAIQSEYSITHGLWGRIRIEPGIELYYRNCAIGMELKKQIRFDNAVWAFNELRFYISFRGNSVLL